jgi:histidine ammonia-lyase
VTDATLPVGPYKLQAKSFELDVVEAQGYQGAIEAADQLRSLLEGSKAVGSRAPGTKKGMQLSQQAAYNNLPQVHACVRACVRVCVCVGGGGGGGGGWGGGGGVF